MGDYIMTGIRKTAHKSIRMLFLLGIFKLLPENDKYLFHITELVVL